jgi:nucleoside-diphosphate-sugar epimerase
MEIETAAETKSSVVRKIVWSLYGREDELRHPNDQRKEDEMRIFVAGATGAIGKRLIPLMVSSGHQVFGMTRSAGKAGMLRAAGAEPVIADALDAEAVRNAVVTARPTVVVHEMTALSKMNDLRHFDTGLAETNRLRTEGTRNLLRAAHEAGVERFIAQSFTGWPNVHTGGRVKTEEDPVDPNPPKAMRNTLAAIRQLEEMVSVDAGLTGVVLRYGAFYGPGTSITEGGDIVEMVRQRKLPIFGGGTGVWSFIHIDDAAAATLIAAERAPDGIYNIVDDEPAEVSEWLPELAGAIGAKPPRRLPAWIGRLAMGEAGLHIMTQVRGSSNAKAKRVLGWRPSYGSWREGFRSGLSDKLRAPRHVVA